MGSCHKIPRPDILLGGGNGANPVTALPLETRVLRHHGGRHRHFYILDKRDEYKIAKIINQPEIMSSFCTLQKPLTEYQNVEEMYQVFDDTAFRERIPYNILELILHSG